MAVKPEEAHILVVEDNVYNYQLLNRLLAFLGIKDIQWKRSGKEVLEFADSLEQVDLILLDIHLPYEDGYSALAKLRAHPRFANTTVVAVTAEATEENMERARQSGFNGFIGKPIDPDRIPTQIEMLLRDEGVWDVGTLRLSSRMT
ncbi:MAG: response regulator [Chloroflexi bacterium]|nr:response regulator [Chloroflexota bacterium]MBU1751388.1 response regulator [Chloroflexota bacterium]